MTKHHRLTSSLLAATTAIVWATATPECRAEDLLSKAKMIIEYNSTDEDVGVQVLLDGEPWKVMNIFNPAGRKLLNILATNSLKQQGLTELFFESSVPSLDEVPLDVFLARFPEGIYEFEGLTTDGLILEGEVQFIHAIPAGPEIVSPASMTSNPPVINPNKLVIDWDPVTESIFGSPIDIVGYQVIVEQVDPLREFSIDVPANVTSVEVAPEFFEQANTLHKFEVLAIESGKNQTITSGEFVTMP